MIQCECVERHVPLPMTYKQVKVEDEVIQLCPTTYANVRELLTEFILRDSLPPGRITKHYSKYVRELCFRIWRDGKNEAR